MVSRFSFLVGTILRRLWLRAALFAGLSLVTVVVAYILDPYLADLLSLHVDRAATEALLQLLATSMLPVTTFSLSTMVSGFSAATSNVTPRATPLVTEDRTAQNAISIFLGSFIYAVMGLVTMHLGFFGDEGSISLFCVSLAMMIWIVVTFLRWMDHLSTLVRVDETTKRVEDAADDAFGRWIEHPFLGARPHQDWGPDAGFPILSGRDGYLQHADMGALQAVATAAGTEIRLDIVPGAYLHKRLAVAASRKPLDAGAQAALIDALSLGDRRTFENDPRFGLITIAEIASRALSPGINDPGTAIAALNAGARVLGRWIDAEECHETCEVVHPAIFARRLGTADMFDDLIRPVARDGAGLLEVAIRLQKILGILALAGDGRHAELARRHAQSALERSLAAMDRPEDATLITDVARGCGVDTVPVRAS
ncbi:DUF2254 domain-containing protein [Methylobrevis pamukkalensis]|uniref:DUF2254 domain-containing protein n=1 Tax=Methylobrevis pamukkalensis TaxID=1439726 RepID=A0A1E3H875_9HYPH|nr:DUF2254 domain-containing protein [Methylobrevis pamukkalensis]ODN72532.1 hypothetical protein A6302_00023 [Methylobrevis pamukkalensis]